MTTKQETSTTESSGRRAPGKWPRPVVGAAVGLLVFSIALAAGQLVSDFVSGAASPVTAVGQQAVNRSPEGLKSFAIRTFGAHDKLVLVSGIVVVLALLAAVLGMWSTRHRWIGFLAVVVLAAVGAAAAMSAPEASSVWALPSLAAGVAGAIAYSVLSRLASPVVEGGWDSVPAEPEADQVSRRRFLWVAGATAGAALLATGIARSARRRLLAGDVSRVDVRIPAPATPAPPVSAGASLHVPGISPFVTPTNSFYRVDTSLFPPQIAAKQWSLLIHGMVDREIRLDYEQLLARPLVERDITLCCVSNPVGGQYVGNARWIGAPLKPILEEAGVHPGANQIVTRSPDSMTIGTPTALAMDGRDAMLAVAMNGQPLPVEHGFPVRMLIPGLYGYISGTKWIVDMELTTFAAFDAYWVREGWAQQTAIKTQSRIDTPRSGAHLSAGAVSVAGVAWAQHTGIGGVQVRVDEGPWHQAQLAAQDTVDTWRQWVWHWDATPGKHTLAVRATDDSGVTQTPQEAKPFPSGATGWHTIELAVG